MSGFEKEWEFTIGQQTTVTSGQKVRVKGYRGLWTFLALVHPRDRRRSDWVDVYKDGQGHRSFAPKLIRRA